LLKASDLHAAWAPLNNYGPLCMIRCPDGKSNNDNTMLRNECRDAADPLRPRGSDVVGE
jgi:hypothetical protein